MFLFTISYLRGICFFCLSIFCLSLFIPIFFSPTFWNIFKKPFRPFHFLSPWSDQMSPKRETRFTITKSHPTKSHPTKSHPTKSHPTHFQVLLKTISIFGFLLMYRKYYMIIVFIYVLYFLVTPYVYCKQYNFRKKWICQFIIFQKSTICFQLKDISMNLRMELRNKSTRVSKLKLNGQQKN